MARPHRVTDRSRHRDRHGRGLRSSVAGPHLPFLRTRVDTFDDVVAATVEYLRELRPDDLDDVTVEVEALPADPDEARVERWRVDRRARRIVLYRLPIERLTPVPESRRLADPEQQHRSVVEGWVFRAVADLLGEDPWEIAPERWREG